MDLMELGTTVAQEAVFNLLESVIIIPKTLVQLGYEPVPAKPYKNFLMMSGYLRPSALKYTGLLVKEHGYDVLMTGFSARLLERLTYRLAFVKANEVVSEAVQLDNRAPVAQRVVAAAATAAVAQGTAVVVCHPFRLLGVRLIGQLVGGPQPYTPFGLLNIFETEGIPGLYSGLGSALIAEVVHAVVMTSATALAYEFVVPLMIGSKDEIQEAQNEEEAAEIENHKYLRQFVSAQVAASLGSPFFYPFQVTRSIMLVNGTNLDAAGLTPTFSSTFDCISYLSLQKSHRGLMRGANIMRRFTWTE